MEFMVLCTWMFQLVATMKMKICMHKHIKHRNGSTNLSKAIHWCIKIYFVALWFLWFIMCYLLLVLAIAICFLVEIYDILVLNQYSSVFIGLEMMPAKQLLLALPCLKMMLIKQVQVSQEDSSGFYCSTFFFLLVVKESYLEALTTQLYKHFYGT